MRRTPQTGHNPKKTIDYFISRSGASTTDVAIAKNVENTLRRSGFSVVSQDTDFGAQNFLSAMHEALIASRKVIAIMSAEYLDSEYCRTEWLYPLHGDPLNKKERLIVLRVSACEPVGLLRNIAYWDIAQITNDSKLFQNFIDRLSTKKASHKNNNFLHQYYRKPDKLRHTNIQKINGFAGRRAEIEKLKILLSNNQPIIISGMGGSGKSTLARQFSAESLESFSGAWWVALNNGDINFELELQMKFLAKTLMPEIDPEPGDKAWQFLVCRLLHLLNFDQPLLLVVDNIEDIETFLSSPLCQSERIKIVGTTRIRNWPKSVQLITVGALLPSDAENLFIHLANRDDLLPEDVQKLCAALHHLPLAVVQAACLMRQFHTITASALSVDVAGQLMGRSSSDDLEVCIFRLFSLALGKADEIVPGSAYFMSILSYLNNSHISQVAAEYFFSTVHGRGQQDKGSKFDRIIGILQNLSLIEYAPSTRKIIIHDLVKLAALEESRPNSKKLCAVVSTGLGMMLKNPPSSDRTRFMAELSHHIRHFCSSNSAGYHLPKLERQLKTEISIRASAAQPEEEVPLLLARASVLKCMRSRMWFPKQTDVEIANIFIRLGDIYLFDIPDYGLSADYISKGYEKYYKIAPNAFMREVVPLGGKMSWVTNRIGLLNRSHQAAKEVIKFFNQIPRAGHNDLVWYFTSLSCYLDYLIDGNQLRDAEDLCAREIELKEKYSLLLSKDVVDLLEALLRLRVVEIRLAGGELEGALDLLGATDVPMFGQATNVDGASHHELILNDCFWSAASRLAKRANLPMLLQFIDIIERNSDSINSRHPADCVQINLHFAFSYNVACALEQAGEYDKCRSVIDVTMRDIERYCNSLSSRPTNEIDGLIESFRILDCFLLAREGRFETAERQLRQTRDAINEGLFSNIQSLLVLERRYEICVGIALLSALRQADDLLESFQALDLAESIGFSLFHDDVQNGAVYAQADTAWGTVQEFDPSRGGTIAAPLLGSPISFKATALRLSGLRRLSVGDEVEVTYMRRGDSILPADIRVVRNAQTDKSDGQATEKYPGVQVADDAKWVSGKVKWFNPIRGFGWIVSEELGDDVFVHMEALRRSELTGLRGSQKIQFRYGTGIKGLMAVDLRLMETAQSFSGASVELGGEVFGIVTRNVSKTYSSGRRIGGPSFVGLCEGGSLQVRVLGVIGAPSAGNRTLSKFLMREITISELRSPIPHLKGRVIGKVNLEQVDNEYSSIEIDWLVFDSDANLLGTISQVNQIETPDNVGDWELIAEGATSAAGQRIVELIQAGRQPEQEG